MNETKGSILRKLWKKREKEIKTAKENKEKEGKKTTEGGKKKESRAEMTEMSIKKTKEKQRL